MKRAALLVTLALALLAASLVAETQQAFIRIGWLAPEARPYALGNFRQALKDLGWVEGGSLAIEERYALPM